ncbi:lipid phosphate phosphohydrolase 3 isoform X1 [Fasciolopsis buskii]|uniref:Lipid phosphate phosphohydrolase 3 isoform X1 n=1 Tax=Fasciolopsis buskii TaxID=27845 RepID=A0A8E0S9H1_9TREM|nr:lipid phosphate phosphohydrolase 3 isoform X1 [Fasciolopsis buski]
MDLESQKSRLAAKIITDLLVAILLHVSALLIPLAGRPTRGFFCDDYTIRYPYKPDTVSTVGVGLYGYLIPLLLVRLVKNLIFCLQIIIVEILIATYKRCADGDYNSFKKAWPPIYNYGIAFFIAGGLTLSVTTVIKYSLGRLRPHFIDACQPDKFTINCTGFIDHYTCQNTDQKIVKDAFLSFISGHSSIASAGIVFAVLYLQSRLQLKPTPLVRPLVQAVLISTCLYIGFTRVTDFKHHPTDVLGGFVLGSLCSITVVSPDRSQFIRTLFFLAYALISLE